MAPKSKSELMRESRKRKRDSKLRKSGEFINFLRDTPFSSNTTDTEKFEAFIRFRATNAPSPASNAERCKKYREVDNARKRESNKLRMRNARFKNKLEIIPIAELPLQVVIDEPLAADNEFDCRFNQNRFGVSCTICDHLWFEHDMKQVPSNAVNFVREKFQDNPYDMRVCNVL